MALTATSLQKRYVRELRRLLHHGSEGSTVCGLRHQFDDLPGALRGPSRFPCRAVESAKGIKQLFAQMFLFDTEAVCYKLKLLATASPPSRVSNVVCERANDRSARRPPQDKTESNPKRSRFNSLERICAVVPVLELVARPSILI
jgi:hypothetical protein